MNILQVLYYYEPYTSGLTVYASRLAKELSARGHDVSVLASRHDRMLPGRETTPDGLHIRRIPVAMSLDRAVIVPTLAPTAAAMMAQADVVHLHLPMAEAALLAGLGRAMGKRVIATHHADLVLEGNRMSRVAAAVAKWSGMGAASLASALVTNTSSRARVSPVTRRLRKNVRIVPPPVVVQPVGPGARTDFRREFRLGTGPIIGYVGRYASEKGIDVLLQTIPVLREQVPGAIIALAGPRRDERDGRVLEGPWDPWLERYASDIRQLDFLPDHDLARFYAACDVLVLPSTDWTESFGMVQVEAMLCGTPVVASDLPGVSDPVAVTGYGRLAQPGDIADLASSIVEVLTDPGRFRPDSRIVAARYSLDATVDAYERVYRGETDPRDLPS